MNFSDFSFINNSDPFDKRSDGEKLQIQETANIEQVIIPEIWAFATHPDFIGPIWVKEMTNWLLTIPSFRLHFLELWAQIQEGPSRDTYILLAIFETIVFEFDTEIDGKKAKYIHHYLEHTKRQNRTLYIQRIGFKSSIWGEFQVVELLPSNCVIIELVSSVPNKDLEKQRFYIRETTGQIPFWIGQSIIGRIIPENGAYVFTYGLLISKEIKKKKKSDVVSHIKLHTKKEKDIIFLSELDCLVQISDAKKLGNNLKILENLSFNHSFESLMILDEKFQLGINLDKFVKTNSLTLTATLEKNLKKLTLQQFEIVAALIKNISETNPKFRSENTQANTLDLSFLENLEDNLSESMLPDIFMGEKKSKSKEPVFDKKFLQIQNVLPDENSNYKNNLKLLLGFKKADLSMMNKILQKILFFQEELNAQEKVSLQKLTNNFQKRIANKNNILLEICRTDTYIEVRNTILEQSQFVKFVYTIFNYVLAGGKLIPFSRQDKYSSIFKDDIKYLSARLIWEDYARTVFASKKALSKYLRNEDIEEEKVESYLQETSRFDFENKITSVMKLLQIAGLLDENNDMTILGQEYYFNRNKLDIILIAIKSYLKSLVKSKEPIYEIIHIIHTISTGKFSYQNFKDIDTDIESILDIFEMVGLIEEISLIPVENDTTETVIAEKEYKATDLGLVVFSELENMIDNFPSPQFRIYTNDA